MGDWKSVGLKPSELRLDVTLFCGQVFRWRRKWDNSSSSNDAKRQQQFFVGVLGDAVIELQQTNDDILYRVLLSADPSASSSCCVSSNNNNNNNADSNHDSIHNRLLDFFNVGTIQSTLENMYSDFAKRDPLFARVHTHFPGVRVLRQDPFECMITFLCTSNNNIARITMMIDRLCQTFGTYLGELELPTSSAAGSTTTTKHKFYSFPTAAQLSKATEAQLRELGFGYRAGYLVNTITKLAEKAAEQQRRKASPTSETSSSSSSSSSALLDKKHLDEYFASIRSPDFSADKALDELSQYPGIGLKCAACIALYSLDKHNCVPIDVHMWRLARTTYLRHKIVTHTVSSGKSLTPRRVKEIMQIYEDVFGPFAGWAQMVLFATQLASFKKTLPKEIVREFEEKLSSSEKGDEEEENEQVENNSHENTTPTKRRTTTKTKTKLTAAVAAAATATTTKRKNSSSSSSQVVVKQQQQQQEESGAESAETSTLTTPIKTRSRIRYGKRIRPSSSSSSI